MQIKYTISPRSRNIIEYYSSWHFLFTFKLYVIFFSSSFVSGLVDYINILQFEMFTIEIMQMII